MCPGSGSVCPESNPLRLGNNSVCPGNTKINGIPLETVPKSKNKVNYLTLYTIETNEVNIKDKCILIDYNKIFQNLYLEIYS